MSFWGKRQLGKFKVQSPARAAPHPHLMHSNTTNGLGHEILVQVPQGEYKFRLLNAFSNLLALPFSRGQ